MQWTSHVPAVIGWSLWSWLAENWGNLLSVAGLLVSLYALITAGSARRQAETILRRNRTLIAVLRLRTALQHARALQKTKKRSEYLSQDRCNQLRETLAAVAGSDVLSPDERSTLQRAVLWLTRDQKNDAWTRRWMRELVNALAQIHGRLADDFARD